MHNTTLKIQFQSSFVRVAELVQLIQRHWVYVVYFLKNIIDLFSNLDSTAYFL
jgi:hypothetical protein